MPNPENIADDEIHIEELQGATPEQLAALEQQFKSEAVANFLAMEDLHDPYQDDGGGIPTINLTADPDPIKRVRRHINPQNEGGSTTQENLSLLLARVFESFRDERISSVELGFNLYYLVRASGTTELDFESITEMYTKETGMIAPNSAHCKRAFQTVQYWYEKIQISREEIEQIGFTRLYECMPFSRNRADEVLEARKWAETAKRLNGRAWKEVVAEQRGTVTPPDWVKIAIPASLHEQLKALSGEIYNDLKSKARGNPSLTLPMSPNETTTLEFMARVLETMPAEERVALWSAQHTDESKFEQARRKMMIKNGLSDDDLPPAKFLDHILNAVLRSLDEAVPEDDATA